MQGDRRAHAPGSAAPPATPDTVVVGATSALPGEPAEAADAAPAASPADGLGGFQRLRCIGRGGMGEVWLAERMRGELRQTVALKLLRRGMDSEDILQRFELERRILASLDHPGIARLIDAGMSAEGLPWYAMEYVDGGIPITQYAREQALDAVARVRLLAEVCDALAYAQQRLVVHRDLKPGNILVDREGRVRLLDFGIAKLLDEGLDAQQTATGLRAMSPAYAAPEQVLGETVSTATDVYALGIVLYELLTGELPHQRNAQSLVELSRQVAHENTERPSATLRRRLAAGIAEPGQKSLSRSLGAELDTIVLMAMRREPERRYAGAAALAADLRNWLEGRPVAARPDSTHYRLRLFVRRHRLGVSVAAAALLALLVGLSLALWQADIARQQAHLAREQAYQADQVRNFLIAAFQGVSPTTARQGGQFSLAEFIDTTLQRLDHELADSPQSRAALRTTLGSAQRELGEASRARNSLELALQEVHLSGQANSLLHAEALHQQAMTVQALGESLLSEQLAEQALQILEDFDSDKALDQRIALRSTLMRQLNDRGRHREAMREQLALARDRIALNDGEDHRSAVDQLNLCANHWYLSQLHEGLQACERASQLLDSDPDSPLVRHAWVANSRALVLLDLGQIEAAEAELERGMGLVREYLSERHPLMATLRTNLAQVHLLAGRPQDAIQAASAAVALHHELGAAATLRVRGEMVLALALLGNGQIEDAAQRMIEVRETFLDTLGAPNLASVRAWQIEAQLRLQQRQPQTALEALEHSLQLLRDMDLIPHMLQARALELQAIAHREVGEAGLARSTADQAATLLAQLRAAP